MTETYASLYNHPTQHQTLMAGALACKMIVNNLIGHKFACLAFCQEGLYEMPCSGFQPVQPVGWKLGWPGRWASRWAWLSRSCLQRWAWPARCLGKRVGVAVHALPPEVGVALLSACLWLPAPSPGSLQP